MLAAAWPDEVRSDKKHPEYNHPKWHYTDEPFKPAGQPESVETVPPDEENIMMAYGKNVAIMKNELETPRNRAIAVCWVFHLIGDIHQPCHTTSLFTTEYPKGDKSANLIFIKVGPGCDVIPLHWFWDDLILAAKTFAMLGLPRWNCGTALSSPEQGWRNSIRRVRSSNGRMPA